MRPLNTAWTRAIELPQRVLVIDDEEVIHLSLKRLFKKLPFTTRCVHSPSQGLELATHYSWDLVLLDLCMPEMNGLQLLASLRTVNRTTPIIVMTAYLTPQRALQALRLGAAEVVPKPFTKDELFSALSVALRSEAPQAR